MTFHFNEFDAPAALEDEPLKDLTGCPVYKNIEASCSEPGCPNNLNESKLLQIQPDECVRQHLDLLSPRQVWRRQKPTTRETKKKEIFQTEPKTRCVM